jgi:hypothetical protein
MRISVNRNDPVAVSDRVPGLGWELTILLDGEPQNRVITADDERGFIDRRGDTVIGGCMEGYSFNTPSIQVDRLWGKVELHWAQRT